MAAVRRPDNSGDSVSARGEDEGWVRSKNHGGSRSNAQLRHGSGPKLDAARFADAGNKKRFQKAPDALKFDVDDAATS